MNVQDLSQPASQLFAGTRNAAGVFTYNSVPVGSSTPSAQIYEPDDTTRWLLVYNEDPAGTLPTNGCAIYDLSATIGQSANPLIETAPFKVIPLTGQGNTEGNIQGTSHGFFVSQHRTAGNNNASATSLKFYDYEGNQLFSSASDEYKEIITGSEGGGFAIAADESWLIMNDGDKQFLLFDIVWEGNKPVLTLRYALKHSSLTYRQLNLDYAGNLIASGDQSWDVFALPSATNVTLVPARKALTMIHGQGIAVTGITLSNKAVQLEQGTTLAVAEYVQITPDNASNKLVSWESLNESVATVNANGVITGVSVGETSVVVTTMDGNFTDTMAVTVTPIAVRSIRIISGTDGKMTINMGSNYALTYEILPVNAANKNAVWTSSDSTIVGIQGPALIIGNAPGTATVTATTEDGGFQASLEVTVEGETALFELDNSDKPDYQTTRKQLSNGQLLIIRKDDAYTATGQRVTNHK